MWKIDNKGSGDLRTKLLVFLVLILTLILATSGCNNKSEQIYREFIEDSDNTLSNSNEIIKENSEEDTQKVNEDIAGELKIYVYDIDFIPSYEWMCKEFNKKYPNVEFSFTGPETESSTIAEHVTKTSVDLMSGTAGDIIDITGLPYIQYAKNNLLEDLYPYMEKDKSFNIKDYYTNILDALEYDNKLYCMPLSFLYWCVRFNSTLLDETKIDVSAFDTVNYKDIVDIYHKVAVKNDQLLISHLWDQVIFEENEYISYLDEKKEQQLLTH